MSFVQRVGAVRYAKVEAFPRFMGGVVWMLVATSLVASCGETRPLVVTPASVVERTSSKVEAPVAFEFTEVRLTLREDGTWKRVLTNRYEILDRSAVDGWGATEARYSPWYTKKPIITAHVTNVDADGTKHRHDLDPAVLTEEPAYPQAPDVYGDARVLRAPLPNVQVGSVIEEVITTESHGAFLHPAYVHRSYFGSGVPVKRARFVVDAPEDVQLNFKVFDAKVERKEVTSGGRVEVTYEGGPYPAFEALEDALPPDVVRWPNVAVAVGTNWQELARKYEDVVEKALSGIDFESTVAKIVSREDAPRVKATKILQWVKDRIRYVGVEFGDSAIVPYTPDKTLARGFGDCKDQATLMVGLLRAAGLDTEIALLSAGRGEDVSPELPAFNVFNHAIVHVSAPDELYIDPTADLVTLGNLPTSDQGRYTLLVGGPNAGLRRIPEAVASSNTYEEIRTVRLKPSGLPDVHEVARGTGYFDWELRSAFSHPEEQLSKNLEAYVEADYKSETVSGIKHTNPHDLAAPFSEELVAEKTGVGETQLLEAWSDLAEGNLFRWLPSTLLEGEEPRKAPLQLTLPYVAKMVWKVAPPQGFVTSAPPAEFELDFGAGKLTRRVQSHPDGSVTLTSVLALEKTRLGADDVMKFREGYATWAAGSVPRAVFRHGAWDLAQKGKLVEAVRMLSASSATGESAALAKLRMSHVLRPTLEELALGQADVAVELAPNDVDVWREYAGIVSSNGLGKDLGRGFPRERALRAYSKVYELDPKQTYAKLRHGVVLEHDERGERYQVSKESLLAAAAVYDSIPAKELREFSNGDFRNNALYALFWAGEYEQVEERLRGMSADEAPDDLRVMVEAARGGAAAAIALVDRMQVDKDRRNTVLEAASGTLVMTGDYDGAAAILDAIRVEGEQARTIQRRATMLRGVVRTSETALPENTPGDMVAKFLSLSSVRDEADHEFAKRYLAAGAQLEGSTLVKYVESMRQELPAKVTKQLMVDLMRRGNKVQVDGDKRVGYRVRVTFEFGATQTAPFFVVEEGGKFKVRALGEFPAEIGAGAWEALEQGNEARAKQWLDWAREGAAISHEEDPLRVPPFARLWQDGKGDVRGAAAVLAALSGRAKDVLPYLEKRLASAKTDTDKTAFLQALVYAQYQLRHQDESLAAARSLLELVPRSKLARRMMFNALWNTQDFASIQGLAEKGLREKPTDAEKRELKERVASSLSRRGKIAEAKKLYLQLIDEFPTANEPYNTAGWLGLFGKPSQQDIDHVLRGLELERSASSLHTLACLYAELGRIDEAGKTLVELRGMRKNGVLEPHDWYVVGRVAEHLGFVDEAKRAYGKVTKPEIDYPTSTHSLAARRLQKL